MQSTVNGSTSLPQGNYSQAPAVASIPFDSLYIHHPRRWLVVILVAYVCAAALFAVLTPAWQAPDEPAHYNYIAYLAENAALPRLQMGDYDSTANSILVSSRFASGQSIAGMRYEFYQPPLYYITAVPVYLASNGSLLAIRLYNIVLGLGTLLLLYLCLEVVFPGKPIITLTATGFAAFLPMHVAVTASATNDILAELLLMASALILLHWMHDLFYDSASLTPSNRSNSQLLGLGVLLGLGLLTKIYGYAFLPLAIGAVVYTIWWKEHTWRAVRIGLAQSLWLLIPAIALALPMWLRNVALYGLFDPLALSWHDQVVIGQLRPQEFIAANGSLAYYERAFEVTFRSFWGVFGWLGVFMDQRIYTAALFFCGILFLGLLWATVRLISGKPDTDMDSFQVTVLCLLGIWIVVVGLSYVFYNLKFVQHQGRYFFWGMLAISTLVGMGWREVLHPLQGTITGFLAAVLSMSLVASGVMSGDMNSWNIAMVSAIACFLLLQPILLIGAPVPQVWFASKPVVAWAQRPAVARMLHGLRFLAWAAPLLLLFLLDLAAPFLYIQPQLNP